MKITAKQFSRLIFDRKVRWIAIGVVLAFAVIWRSLPDGPAGEFAGAANVRDGDSVNVGRHRVRLEGVDAPERAQSCGAADATWPCGEAAEAHLARLIAGRTVTCAWTRRDRHGRYLARCSAGDDDLNARMVLDGMAVSLDGNFARAERAARTAGRGLWAGPFLRPAVWRRQNPRGGG